MPLSSVADELTQLVDSTTQKLKNLDSSRTTARPAPGKWSIQEILGHLVDSACNNHQRFVRALEVDELVFPKYTQDPWVDLQGYNDSPWLELLTLWRTFNLHLAHLIRRIPDNKLAVRCYIGDYEPATLQWLVEDYVVHMRHHLKAVDALAGDVDAAS